MTKSDLVEAIAATSPDRTKKDVEGAVNTIFRAMCDALVRGERIEIRGLGSFRVKERVERVGRNPKTGEMVRIPTRRVPHFIVGKALRARVENVEPEVG
ncbi:MAG: integration host factor subunit beta [Myxococcales bacterium]|nr:integration host factor subunit beta [Myxococcales bacterium]